MHVCTYLILPDQSTLFYICCRHTYVSVASVNWLGNFGQSQNVTIVQSTVSVSFAIVHNKYYYFNILLLCSYIRISVTKSLNCLWKS